MQTVENLVQDRFLFLCQRVFQALAVGEGLRDNLFVHGIALVREAQGLFPLIVPVLVAHNKVALFQGGDSPSRANYPSSDDFPMKGA